MLIASLQECSDATVLSNVRDTPVEPISWLEDRLKSCVRVVLIFSPLGKSNFETKNEKDPFSIGINMLLEERKRKFLYLATSHKFYIVYLDKDITTCVPKSIRSKKIKFFQLPKNISSFYEYIAGVKFQDVPEKHVKDLKRKIAWINSDVV